MKSFSTDLCLEIWQRATACEFGLAVGTLPEHRRMLQNALYEARKIAANPAYDEFLVMLPNNDQVWLVRKTVEL